MGDLEISVITQCVKKRCMEECRFITIGNLLVKINAKMGGINSVWSRSPKVGFQHILHGIFKRISQGTYRECKIHLLRLPDVILVHSVLARELLYLINIECHTEGLKQSWPYTLSTLGYFL